MTSLAPGGVASDANLVESALATLRSSASGAQVVDRLLAVGAKVNVINDNEFAALGHGEAHAFFDPSNDTIYMRRSELQGPDHRFSAVALAHEGTHLLDDVAGVADPFVARKAQVIAAAGGLATPAGAEAQKQAIFELTMIKEARAFTFAGQVAKELAVATPANDATSISAAGANDQATYGRVWNALLTSAYNPEKRTAAVANF
jgi:antirestriction protein ArdC